MVRHIYIYNFLKEILFTNAFCLIPHSSLYKILKLVIRETLVILILALKCNLYKHHMYVYQN